MKNLIFIKIEILILVSSFLYILYYLWIKLLPSKLIVKNITKPSKKKSKKILEQKVKFNCNNWETDSKKKSNVKISDIDKDKVNKILKRVRVNSIKWYFDTARSLIVEWLSLDKYNRDLNIELASIYEKEQNYINAEYIYKDLLEILKADIEVMKKLGYIYAMQNKLKDSLKMYEKIHNKKKADDEVIDLLSELAFTMKHHKKALKYVNLFLVWKPRDVDKLFIKAKSLKVLWKKDEARDVYKRILDLQPYNTKAKDKYEKLRNKKKSSNK